MGEGVIVQRRAGGEGSSLSESYGDSRAAKGLEDAKREYEGLRGKVVWGRGGVVWRRENASRSTGGGGGEGLSSVPGGGAWGGANRVGVWGTLVTKVRGGMVGRVCKGYT